MVRILKFSLVAGICTNPNYVQKYRPLPLMYNYSTMVPVYFKSVSQVPSWAAGIRFPVGAGDFSMFHSVQTGSGAQAASYPMGTRGSFPGDKRQGREADHSPLPCAKCKNGGAIPPLPIRHRGVVLRYFIN
jgi:hypothetical protein